MSERIQPYTRRGRCVECGDVGVTPGAPCKYLKTGHATMDLPEGKTCGDCRHFPHCERMYARIAADESCDFFPVRFVAIAAARQEDVQYRDMREVWARGIDAVDDEQVANTDPIVL